MAGHGGGLVTKFVFSPCTSFGGGRVVNLPGRIRIINQYI